MQMTCPKCHGEMRVYERSGVTVDQCTECRGIFLDRGELEKLFEAEANWSGPGGGAPRPAQAPPAAPRPGGYAAPPPPAPGGYAAPPPPGYGQPAYPAAAPYGAPQPQYGAGYHGHYRQGHHGHYRQKKHKGFLNEFFG
ncbi:zf-TFIIB domain-containing protein [Actinoplanes sp. NPDC049599]|uniref:TFIIB-type zinc ribbon-containing protein n=1 Tax=Actinoplanes sp. NPDC049599 TaxID=3363903 RepID=UPI0037AB45C6